MALHLCGKLKKIFFQKLVFAFRCKRNLIISWINRSAHIRYIGPNGPYYYSSMWEPLALVWFKGYLIFRHVSLLPQVMANIYYTLKHLAAWKQGILHCQDSLG